MGKERIYFTNGLEFIMEGARAGLRTETEAQTMADIVKHQLACAQLLSNKTQAYMLLVAALTVLPHHPTVRKILRHSHMPV